MVYELVKRGHRAVDADDVPGLTAWRNLRTGEETEEPPPPPIDFQTFRFAWREDALLRLFAEKGPVFVCGGAWNARTYYPCFEHVFIVTPEKPQPRLKNQKTPGAGAELPLSDVRIITQESTTTIQGSRSIPDMADEVLELAFEAMHPRTLDAWKQWFWPKWLRFMKKMEERRTPRTAPPA